MDNGIDTLHEEIERLSEKRGDLWQKLSQGHDPATAAELRKLDAELDGLWAELRALRARLRFGDRDAIVARARVEERLERAA
jgi:ABC-type phosphate transport system auxiliary subunit